MSRYRIFMREAVTPPASDYPGFTKVFEDQFATLDTTKWNVYNNDASFGHDKGRIQLYRSANVVVGTGSAGATNGTSMKLLSLNDNQVLNSTTWPYSAGMVDTKGKGFYLPKWGMYEFRCKTPHGQGIWPSIWLTGAVNGATTFELDIMEYFHLQVPGKNSTTFYSIDNTGTDASSTRRFTNNGATWNGQTIQGRTFFEAPTFTPAGIHLDKK